MLSSSLNVPVINLPSAGEGGPYGEALLASYLIEKKENQTLEDYLDKDVFSSQESKEFLASEDDVKGFSIFMEKYIKALKIENETIKAFK